MVDCFTHADQQQWNSCRRTYCNIVIRRKSCQLLIWEGDGHCQRQGWYRQLSMPALDLTPTDAPGMQLCTPLVARQEASATELARARCGHIVWRRWWDVRLCSGPTVISELWQRQQTATGKCLEHCFSSFCCQWLNNWTQLSKLEISRSAKYSDVCR